MAEAVENNLSLFLHAKDDLRLEDAPIPVPRDHEVLLKISSVGICGTDISLWKKGCLGHIQVTTPSILGHESSGTVIGVGKNVTHLAVGDEVAIEPGVPCRYCEYCKIGRYNLCRNSDFCGLPPHNGNLTRIKAHAADFCYKLPSHVSLDEGALCEPAAVAVNACRRAKVSLGHTVLIIGAGPIGLMTLLVAKARGATRIVVTDLSEHRLKVAQELGASNTLLFDQGFNCLVTAKKMLDALGSPPDISIETSGSESGLKFSIYATRRGGTVAIVGLGQENLNVPILHAATREIEIQTVWCYANDYPAALAFISASDGEAKKLITHHFKLEDALEAYETARTGADNAIKVIIHC